MIQNIKYNLENNSLFKLIYLSIFSSVVIPVALGYLSRLTQHKFANELGIAGGIYIVIGIFMYVACSILILINFTKKNKN